MGTQVIEELESALATYRKARSIDKKAPDFSQPPLVTNCAAGCFNQCGTGCYTNCGASCYETCVSNASRSSR